VLVPSGSTLVSAASIESSHKSRDFSSEKPNYIIQNPSNNQTAAAPLKDMILDKTKHKLVVYEGDLYRSDSTQGKTALVKLICSYNIFTDQWIFVPQLEGEDTGITFQFDQSKQQVTYKSTNYGGSGHTATLTLRTQVTER
jgi:hypothetical protein